MPTHGSEYIEVDDVSRTLAVLGFYVSVIGLVSYTVKERLYMSDALLALIIGICVGPIGWNLVSPWDWVNYNDETRQRLTYEFCRIVIGIQVLFTGIALPKAYLRHAWESLTTLLLLVMTCAWLVSGAFIFALLPDLTFLEALCVAACVTPTDPVLANSVVKGRFAEKHIPVHVRNLIAAESGANDGLGFPFIFLAIYLLARFNDGRSIGQEIGWWIVDIWLYQIALSIAIGAVIGYVARKAVKFAERHELIDHESFLAIGVGLTFLTLGLTGMLGSDDILAAFIVGNSFTWDDYFRVRTEDESFQDVLDSLINAAIFIYIGTVLPWASFGDAALGLSAWRLVVLGILLLLFRRLPWVLLSIKIVPDLKNWREAIFTGWFGPIGVGAVYYAQVGLREIPEDREHLRAVIVPIVYFIVLCSVVVHGITIPVFMHSSKAYSRTMSFARSRTGNSDAFDQSTKFQRAKPTQSQSASQVATARNSIDLAEEGRASTMEQGSTETVAAPPGTAVQKASADPAPPAENARVTFEQQEHRASPRVVEFADRNTS